MRSQSGKYRLPSQVFDVMRNECVDRLEWARIHIADIHIKTDYLPYCLKDIVGLASKLRPQEYG